METSLLREFAAIAGIDWADRKHDICLQAAGSTKREFCVLAHRPEAIAQWAEGLRERFGGRPVAVCLELAKGPLVYALQRCPFLVLFPVNPATLAKYRQAFHVSGAKDDSSDAQLALELLLTHPRSLAAFRRRALPCARSTNWSSSAASSSTMFEGSPTASPTRLSSTIRSRSSGSRTRTRWCSATSSAVGPTQAGTARSQDAPGSVLPRAQCALPLHHRAAHLRDHQRYCANLRSRGDRT